MSRRWFRDRDQEWYAEQDQNKQWIKQQENKMAKYTQVLEGFLNDNSEGVQKNAKAPKYRSSGSGKSAIVTTQDIPAGSVIAFAAWGGRGDYGPYIKLTGQLIGQDDQAQQAQPEPGFDDEIPF